MSIDTARKAVEITDGTLTATVRDTGASDSLNVAITDASGGQITTFGVSKVDDAAFSVASDSVTPIGALCDETATDSVDEGDVGVVRMTADRKLYVETELPTAAALTDDMANPTAPAVAAHMMGYDGATWDRLVAGKLHDLDTGAGTEYNVGVSLRIAASGGSTEIGTSTTPVFVQAGVLAPVAVIGSAQHDSNSPANPINVAGLARSTADATAVSTAGDVVHAQYDMCGRQVVRMSPRGLTVHNDTTLTNADVTSEVTLLAAGAASVFRDLVALLVIIDTPGATGTLAIKEAPSGATIMTIPYTSGAFRQHEYVFTVPVKQSAAAAAWVAAASAALVTGTIYFFTQAVEGVA